MVDMGSIKPTIDVCIATYKRPGLLKKLLMSLITQETNGEFSFNIIVVDNDHRRSAEATVHEFETKGQKIIYDVEPERSISLTRNRSLSHATGDYIATIDDDEYADSQWLLNLYKTMISHKADVVHGPVSPIFHKSTPSYVRKSNIFNLPNPPTGSTEDYVCATGNSLFRRRLIESMATPFIPRFGRTGGEDTRFFENLRKQGYKMIWCREAQVFEFTPPERANLVWILKRNFRIGNGWHHACDEGPFNTTLSKKGEIFYICWKLVMLGCTVPFYILGGILSGIFNLTRRRDRYTIKAINRLEKIAFCMGIISYFLKFRYEEYREGN
jgi:succinoglycan biosynthesis protein ExoM